MLKKFVTLLLLSISVQITASTKLDQLVLEDQMNDFAAQYIKENNLNPMANMLNYYEYQEIISQLDWFNKTEDSLHIVNYQSDEEKLFFRSIAEDGYSLSHSKKLEKKIADLAKLNSVLAINSVCTKNRCLVYLYELLDNKINDYELCDISIIHNCSGGNSYLVYYQNNQRYSKTVILADVIDRVTNDSTVDLSDFTRLQGDQLAKFSAKKIEGLGNHTISNPKVIDYLCEGETCLMLIRAQYDKEADQKGIISFVSSSHCEIGNTSDAFIKKEALFVLICSASTTNKESYLNYKVNLKSTKQTKNILEESKSSVVLNESISRLIYNEFQNEYYNKKAKLGLPILFDEVELQKLSYFDFNLLLNRLRWNGSRVLSEFNYLENTSPMFSGAEIVNVRNRMTKYLISGHSPINSARYGSLIPNTMYSSSSTLCNLENCLIWVEQINKNQLKNKPESYCLKFKQGACKIISNQESTIEDVSRRVLALEIDINKTSDNLIGYGLVEYLPLAEEDYAKSLWELDLLESIQNFEQQRDYWLDNNKKTDVKQDDWFVYQFDKYKNDSPKLSYLECEKHICYMKIENGVFKGSKERTAEHVLRYNPRCHSFFYGEEDEDLSAGLYDVYLKCFTTLDDAHYEYLKVIPNSKLTYKLKAKEIELFVRAKEKLIFHNLERHYSWLESRMNKIDEFSEYENPVLKSFDSNKEFFSKMYFPEGLYGEYEDEIFDVFKMSWTHSERELLSILMNGVIEDNNFKMEKLLRDLIVGYDNEVIIHCDYEGCFNVIVSNSDTVQNFSCDSLREMGLFCYNFSYILIGEKYFYINRVKFGEDGGFDRNSALSSFNSQTVLNKLQNVDLLASAMKDYFEFKIRSKFINKKYPVSVTSLECFDYGCEVSIENGIVGKTRRGAYNYRDQLRIGDVCELDDGYLTSELEGGQLLKATCFFNHSL